MQRITFDLLMHNADGEPFHAYVTGEGVDAADCAQDAITRAEDYFDAGCSDWSPMSAPALGAGEQ